MVPKPFGSWKSFDVGLANIYWHRRMLGNCSRAHLFPKGSSMEALALREAPQVW